MIKVLLVDDHALVRSGIEALLNAMENIVVIGSCDCGEQALKFIKKVQPDLILMDINMPGMGGIEACRRILQIHPEIKLIGLSVHDNGQTQKQLLKLGVKGFISKSSPVQEMITAIHAVNSGQQYVTTSTITTLTSETNPFTKLSTREQQVALLILQGKSIPEISTELKVNSKTVNTYRYRLYAKLNINNNSDAELTHLATKFNFFNPH